jgi:hypothetical protein
MPVIYEIQSVHNTYIDTQVKNFTHHFTLMSVICVRQKCSPGLTENGYKSEGFQPPQPQVQPLHSDVCNL